MRLAEGIVQSSTRFKVMPRHSARCSAASMNVARLRALSISMVSKCTGVSCVHNGHAYAASSAAWQWCQCWIVVSEVCSVVLLIAVPPIRDRPWFDWQAPRPPSNPVAPGRVPSAEYALLRAAGRFWLRSR